MTPQVDPRVTLPWLVRLRWLWLLGQVMALGAAAWLFDLPLAWWAAGAAAGTTLASNLALSVALRRRPGLGLAAPVTGGVLALDAALLTLLLAAAGGPMNPFTVLYLVHITLSAVVLSARWTTLIAALSVAGFGSLFLLPYDPHAFHRGAGMRLHLQGMWVAFVLAAGLTAYFVRRILQALALERAQIARLRETSARNARLAALTTLAAGAAHELGTPLGTIAVAAHEALLGAEELAGAQPLAEDLRLILLEVERCQAILNQLAVRSANGRDEPAHVAPSELLRRVRAHLGSERGERVEFRLQAATALGVPAGSRTDALELDAPAGSRTEALELDAPLAAPEELAQSIAALARNGLEASAGDERVVIELARAAGELTISVRDFGAGIPADLLARVGEPFFTTKAPGRGMGLGVFLARAFAESRGGALEIASEPGGGTRALLRLPLEVA